MKVKDAYMQAYPFIEPEQDENIKAYHPGITLRDYFAAKAMQALTQKNYFDVAAKEAYQMADAMLEARKK